MDFMEPYFTHIYESKQWGHDNNPEYNGNSGGGSEVEYNIDTYVPFLKHFIISNDIRTIVDLGCGDFKCGRLIYDDFNIQYTGYDTYKRLMDYNASQHESPKYSFHHLDFYGNKEQIVGGDLCILKDVLQHWKMEEIYGFMDYLVETKKFKYILICNCCNQTADNPENEGRSTPLSANFFPLKKYGPLILFHYNTKEVSVIDLTRSV